MDMKLVPTEGCYQQEHKAIHLKATRTEIHVQDVETKHIIRFRRIDGIPVLKRDRSFPCYKLVMS